MASALHRSPILFWGRARSGDGRSPLSRYAATATQPRSPAVDEALRAAVGPPSGPAFVEPARQVFFQQTWTPTRRLRSRACARHPAWSCCQRCAASKPVVMAGTGVYWARRGGAGRALRRAVGPVFLNGLARGCVPADHRDVLLARAGTGLKGADLALVIGVPMDFRLGFGGSFSDDTQIVVMGSARPSARTRARWPPAIRRGGRHPGRAARRGPQPAARAQRWVTSCARSRSARRASRPT